MMSENEPHARSDQPDGEVGRLMSLADRVLAAGAPGDQIEIVLARSSGISVRVHGGEVEALTASDHSGAGIRVIRDGRLGFAHCGTLDLDVLLDTLEAASDNCNFGEPDPHNALVEPDGVPVVRQQSWSSAVDEFDTDQRIATALELERLATGTDPRVRTARSTSYADGSGASVIASTLGIRAGERFSSCSVSTQPMANADGETQIGASFDAAREPGQLDLELVAAEAVERAVRLLGSQKPPSARLTVLLEPRLALQLMGIVAGMLNGEAVVKGRSPFADRRGEVIASPLLSLRDDPTCSESLGAEEVDGEGLATRPNQLVDSGVLVDFLRDGYVGRRTGEGSTASAVRSTRSLPGPGAQVLVMTPGTRSFDDLVASIELGLWVNSLTGLHSGVNPVSGDFSVGADGVMIRGGALAEPVRELTLASTLQRLLLDVSEVGGDGIWLPSGHYGASLVIDDVAVSGA